MTNLEIPPDAPTLIDFQERKEKQGAAILGSEDTINALTRKRTETFCKLQSSVQGHPVGTELLQKTSMSSEG